MLSFFIILSDLLWPALPSPLGVSREDGGWAHQPPGKLSAKQAPAPPGCWLPRLVPRLAYPSNTGVQGDPQSMPGPQVTVGRVATMVQCSDPPVQALASSSLGTAKRLTENPGQPESFPSWPSVTSKVYTPTSVLHTWGICIFLKKIYR